MKTALIVILVLVIGAGSVFVFVVPTAKCDRCTDLTRLVVKCKHCSDGKVTLYKSFMSEKKKEKKTITIDP